MIKLDKDKWVSVIDCHFCKKQTPTKEAISTPFEYEYFGVNGTMYVAVCKECHRESQLNKLI
jgi:hypothetical protein